MTLRDAYRITRTAVGEVTRGRESSQQRGMALMFAMVAMMVLVTFSLNFVYNERTSIYMNGNITASVKAHLHARGSMRIAMLAVNAKKSFPLLKGALSLMGKSGGAKIEVWRQACEFTKVFCQGKPHFFGSELMDLSEEESVGLARGSCDCTVTSEDSRINLNAASTDRATDVARAIASSGKRRAGSRRSKGARSKRPASRAQARLNLGVRLYGLFRPLLEKDEFDNEDEIFSVVANIMDWTDEDDVQTLVERLDTALRVSDEGSGPEPSYDYESKDAKMDSVGEVQLVEGMRTDLYCKFRDEFTVFATEKINVNDAGLAVLKGILCEAITDDLSRLKFCFNPSTPLLQPIDEILLAMDRCRKLKRAVFSTPFTQMKRFTQFFKQYPAVMGLPDLTLPLNNRVINSQLGIETTMVRIEARGSYCWSTGCEGFCVYPDRQKDANDSAHTKCKDDKECGGGYCSKRTTDRKMTAIIDMSTGSLVHFDSK